MSPMPSKESLSKICIVPEKYQCVGAIKINNMYSFYWLTYFWYNYTMWQGVKSVVTWICWTVSSLEEQLHPLLEVWAVILILSQPQEIELHEDVGDELPTFAKENFCLECLLKQTSLRDWYCSELESNLYSFCLFCR